MGGTFKKSPKQDMKELPWKPCSERKPTGKPAWKKVQQVWWGHKGRDASLVTPVPAEQPQSQVHSPWSQAGIPQLCVFSAISTGSFIYYFFKLIVNGFWRDVIKTSRCTSAKLPARQVCKSRSCLVGAFRLFPPFQKPVAIVFKF